MNKSFIIKNKDTKTTQWSGGKTTELFIYPPKSNFKNLDFDFRLSNATIEVDESDFTSLPNINRTLLLLDGELELIHKDHHSKKLEIFDTDNFNGSWETKSIGKAVDFNFMSTKNIKPVLNVLEFNKGAEFTEKNLNTFCCLYNFKGKIKTKHGILNTGDVLITNEKGLFDYKILENSVLVHLVLDLD